jgi:DNA-directed RNA polymerase subunit RPC12/RpoP
MEASYLCPDCGHEHGDPAEAILGMRVRCLDCQIEIDLAEEFRLIPLRLVAA